MYICKGTVHPRTVHKGPEGEQRYSSILSLTPALDGVCCQRHGRGRFLPGKETRYPLYRRLGGPHDPSGRVRKISTPTGIRSPDLSVCSESLYRQRYAGSKCTYVFIQSTHYSNQVLAKLEFSWTNF